MIINLCIFFLYNYPVFVLHLYSYLKTLRCSNIFLSKESGKFLDDKKIVEQHAKGVLFCLFYSSRLTRAPLSRISR